MVDEPDGVANRKNGLCRDVAAFGGGGRRVKPKSALGGGAERGRKKERKKEQRKRFWYLRTESTSWIPRTLDDLERGARGRASEKVVGWLEPGNKGMFGKANDEKMLSITSDPHDQNTRPLLAA